MQQSEKLTLANEYRVAVTCGRFMRMRFTLASGIFALYIRVCTSASQNRKWAWSRKWAWPRANCALGTTVTKILDPPLESIVSGGSARACGIPRFCVIAFTKAGPYGTQSRAWLCEPGFSDGDDVIIPWPDGVVNLQDWFCLWRGFEVVRLYWTFLEPHLQRGNKGCRVPVH